jgi:hypothetical protein
MNYISIGLISFLLSSFTFAARDTFIINELNVKTLKTQKIVQGEIKAKNLFVKYNGNEFEARDDSGKLVEANVSIFENVFKANTSFLKYQTTLEDDNPLIALDELTLTNANVNFGKTEMFFELPKASIQLDGTSVAADEITGHCDPKGDTTTDVDIVCLKNGVVTMSKVHFINESIDMLAKGLNTTITPDTLGITSDSTLFTSGGQKTQVNIFKANCRNAIKRRFNQAEMLNGCFQSADFYLDGFSEFKRKQLVSLEDNTKALVDLEDIKKLQISIRNHAISLRAKVKIIFNFNLKVRGKINFLEEQKIIKLDIEKASIAGIPAKSLTLMVLKMFLDEDSIKIEGDTIFIAV